MSKKPNRRELTSQADEILAADTSVGKGAVDSASEPTYSTHFQPTPHPENITLTQILRDPAMRPVKAQNGCRWVNRGKGGLDAIDNTNESGWSL